MPEHIGSHAVQHACGFLSMMLQLVILIHLKCKTSAGIGLEFSSPIRIQHLVFGIYREPCRLVEDKIPVYTSSGCELLRHSNGSVLISLEPSLLFSNWILLSLAHQPPAHLPPTQLFGKALQI